MALRQYVIVARHSLRRDEVDETWVSQVHRPWDPPLAEEASAKVRLGPPLSEEKKKAEESLLGSTRDNDLGLLNSLDVLGTCRYEILISEHYEDTETVLEHY